MAKLLRILDGLITFLSPIAALFFILCSVLLIAELSERSSRMETLLTEGQIVTATVDHLYDDGDILITFVDDEARDRSAIIKQTDYVDGTVSNLQLDATVEVYYDPRFRYDPLLVDNLNEFEMGAQRVMGLIIFGGICLVILAIRPDLLYIVYVEDWDALYRRELEKALQKKGT